MALALLNGVFRRTRAFVKFYTKSYRTENCAGIVGTKRDVKVKSQLNLSPEKTDHAPFVFIASCWRLLHSSFLNSKVINRMTIVCYFDYAINVLLALLFV